MKPIYLISLLSLFVLSSCKDQKLVETELAQQVVDKVIDKVGGDTFKRSQIAFDFRERHYVATRNKGKFQYERIWMDPQGEIKDMISNSGYKRYINDSLVQVPDSMVVKYSSSINAVHYFSVLPFGLNDRAVNKDYLGEVEIKGKPYHKIEVTFDKEGGGEDYDDVFVYWINKDTFDVDYLSYSYIEDHNDIGLRFREAFNRRAVNGLAFSDYNNYKPVDDSATVYNLDSLFVANQLKLLSKIELKNIEVNLLPEPGR